MLSSNNQCTELKKVLQIMSSYKIPRLIILHLSLSQAAEDFDNNNALLKKALKERNSYAMRIDIVK